MLQLGDGYHSAVSDDILTLLREHQKLRSDVEHLLEEKQRLLEQKKGAGDQEKGHDKPKEENSQNTEGKEEKSADPKSEKKEQPKPPFKQRMSAWVQSHPVAFILIIVALVALIIGGYFYWNYLQSYVSTDDAQVDGHTNQIGSRIAGTVTAVYIDDNRSVIPGQVLVDIDPRDYQTAVAQAQASLSQAAAALNAQEPNVPIIQTTEATNVSTARLSVATAEAGVEAARQSHQAALADWEQAKANAENAAAEELRYRHLAEKDEVSRELYDQRATQARAQAAMVTAKLASAEAAEKVVRQRVAELAQVRERAHEAESNQPRQVAVQHAQTAGRQASVDAAKAQLDQARLNLSYCKITAPVAGIVGNKSVEVGQQIAPGQELFAITPTDDIWVTANFKETQIEEMHPGQRVTIHVDALNLDFEGTLENMPGASGAKYSLLPPENATGNYVKVVQRLPVRLRFKSNQRGMERLRPGMSVEPKVWVK